jgi:hypothetical protein
LFSGVAMDGRMFVKNIVFSNTAAIKGIGIINGTTGSACFYINCRFTGFSYGLLGQGSSSQQVNARLINCEIDNCSVDGIYTGASTSGWLCIGCYIHSNGSSGFITPANAGGSSFIKCLIVNNASRGIFSDPTTGMPNHAIYDYTIANNTRSQFESSVTSNPYTYQGQVFIFNSLFYGGQYGIYINGTGSYPMSSLTFARELSNNAFGGSSIANRLNVDSSNRDVDVTKNPFVASASRDYRLNPLNTECRQNGSPKYCGNSVSGVGNFPDIGVYSSSPTTLIS